MSVEVKAGMAFGKYRLERPLGRGGMASIWLARHTLLETCFAVKLLDPAVAGKDPRYVERFLREARLASRIRHPHLVGVYDVGQDAATGLYYLVMEYVPGGNVSQLLAKEGPLPERAALDIVRQVAEALGQAERFGMVHRDIKPDNIMFDEQGGAKLSDLGIAKAELGDEARLTQTAAVFGTPAYMSPEQATDAGKVDARADIYSLGVVCYEMLTGRRPYGGKTVVEILSKIVDKTPPPDVRTVRPDVTPQTATLVRAMMDKACDRRPASAGALLERLARLASEAPEPSPGAAEYTMPTLDALPSSSATLPTQAVAETLGSPAAPTVPSAPRRPRLRLRPLLAAALAGVAVLLGVVAASLPRKAPSVPEPVPPPPTPSAQPSTSPPPKAEPVKEPSSEELPLPTAEPKEEPPPRTEQPNPNAEPPKAGPEPVVAKAVPPVGNPKMGEPKGKSPDAEPSPSLPKAEAAPSRDTVKPTPSSAVPSPHPVTLHLLVGTREVTQAEVTVVAEGLPRHFAKGPYVFELAEGRPFEVSVARGGADGVRWQAVEGRRMATEGRAHVTLPLAVETAEPVRLQGLSVVEDGRPKASVQGRFRKFGGTAQEIGPCSPEELADFLRRNAPGNGNYWLSLRRADGSEARFCPARTPRRAGDAQPYHAGMRLDLTREAVQLYERPAPID